MYRTILALGMQLVVLGGSLAEGQIDAPSQLTRPILRVDDPSFDWGKLVQGDKAGHTFTLHNDGSAVLRIEAVKPACGCTTVEFAETIEPGGSGAVTLELDTKNLQSRRVYKSAVVSSNDPDQPLLKLVMSGDLLPVVDFSPKDVELAGRYSSPKRTVLSVMPGEGSELLISEVRAMSGHVSVAGIERLEASGRHDITLEAPATDRVKELRDVIQLSVVGADGVRREKRIPVLIQHRGRVNAESKAVVFPRSATPRAGHAGSPAVRSVTVSAEGPEVAFTITALRLEGLPEDLFRASMATLEEGRSYVITVECLRPHDAPAVSGRLHVSTDDPEVPSLELPILAQFTTEVGSRVGSRANGSRVREPGD